jgi:hypothetical protein
MPHEISSIRKSYANSTDGLTEDIASLSLHHIIQGLSGGLAYRATRLIEVEAALSYFHCTDTSDLGIGKTAVGARTADISGRGRALHVYVKLTVTAASDP